MITSRIAIISVLLASLVALGQPLAAGGETGWLGVSVGRATPESAEDGRGGIVVTGIVSIIVATAIITIGCNVLGF